jgi:hypothetical protein
MSRPELPAQLLDPLAPCITPATTPSPQLLCLNPDLTTDTNDTKTNNLSA